MLTRLTKMIKRHKKLAVAWLAFEVVSVMAGAPALANFVDNVRFEAKPRTLVSQIERGQGYQVFTVASNAPFAIVSEGVVTPISVSISVDGQNAQAPGPLTGCGMPSVTRASRLYTSQTRTAAKRGDPASQSVSIKLQYDPAFTPDISIVPMDSDQAPALLAMPCTPSLI